MAKYLANPRRFKLQSFEVMFSFLHKKFPVKVYPIVED